MKTYRHAINWLGFALALVLSLCLCLGALAEAGTLFPWLTYTMDVALVSADPEIVDMQDAPDGGVMVLVKLVPDYGTIKTDDIYSHGVELRFRDGDGDEYQAFSVRLRGIEFSAEKGFSTKHEQDSLELLFFLEGKTGVAVAGAKLVVPGDVQGESIIVSLDKAPHEAAIEQQEQNDTP